MKALAPLLLFAAAASADRYWVSPSGDDALSCEQVRGAEDPGRARKTPQKGLECVSVGGDQLTIKAGRYAGLGASLRSNSVPNGTRERPTIIEGEGLDGCAVRGDCGTVLVVDAQASALSGTDFILVRKLEFDCSNNPRTEACLTISGSSGAVVEDVEVHHAHGAGLRVDQFSSRFTARRVNAHHNANTFDADAGTGDDAPGISVAASDSLVEECSICDNGNQLKSTAGGLLFYISGADKTVDRVEARRNVICRNWGSSLYLDGFDASAHHNLIFDNHRAISVCNSRFRLFNNLVARHASAAMAVNQGCDGGTGSIDNNVLLSNPGSLVFPSNWRLDAGANRVTGQVTDCTVSNNDFRTRPNTPCIDSGRAIPGLAFNGSAPDQGPFEAFSLKAARVRGNQLDLDFELVTNGPVQVSTARGWSVDNGRTVLAAEPTDAGLRLTFDGPACQPEEQWSISYDARSGDVTDSAHLGWLQNQPLFSFSNLAVTNDCGTMPRSLYHCGTPGPLLAAALAGVCLRRRRRPR